MIWESGPWKREVARRALSLQRRKSQKRWQQTSGAKLEKDVFYAAFAVRKLIEASKMSDEVESLTIEALEYAPTCRAVDITNWHRLDELYDFSQSRTRSLRLLDFCNQIIHSFMFMASVGEDAASLTGVFVSSDRQKAKGLLHFDIDSVIQLLEAVSQDDIVRLEVRRAGVGEPARAVAKSNSVKKHEGCLERKTKNP